MRRVEPEQVAQLAVCTLAFALLFYPFGWLGMLMLGAPLGFVAGLAMALRYC